MSDLSKYGVVCDTQGNYILTKPLDSTEFIEAASYIASERLATGTSFTDAYVITRFIQGLIGNAEREHFLIVYLDMQHRCITHEILFSGTIGSASIYTREIVKRFLALNAAKVFIAHNHPSGSPEPSEADRYIGDKIEKALALVDGEVLDNIIVTPTPYSYSKVKGGMFQCHRLSD